MEMGTGLLIFFRIAETERRSRTGSVRGHAKILDRRGCRIPDAGEQGVFSGDEYTDGKCINHVEID